MDVTINRDAGMLIVAASGRIEGPEGAETLHRALDEALKPEDQALILDLEKATYLSSAGLRTVAIMMNRARKERVRLIVAAPEGPVRDLFAMSGFDRLVEVVDDVDKAKSTAAA